MSDTAKKHTKKELFENLLVFASAAEADAWVIDGIKHELELLAKRQTAGKGQDAKRAAEVAANMAAVKATLSATEGKRSSEISAELGGDFSVQRVTALLKKLVDAGEVVRTTDKKVTTFTLA